jgi:hypothetical protein
MSRPGIGIVKFTDAELDKIRQLFGERVQSAQPVQRPRIPRRRLQRPPTLAATCRGRGTRRRRGTPTGCAGGAARRIARDDWTVGVGRVSALLPNPRRSAAVPLGGSSYPDRERKHAEPVGR